ncbi:ABC transporter permease [Streptomyces sp. MP131-18]|uniref:ABC transporter permease n=1 Tax=Streptomyces sp. MP131-18 TaxID=1857892 RepID=UPI00097C5435|nr:ABC transporter permease [Streptomyces sp. MP131-18]ONK14455.1 Inner membrane transport permease YbhR [Streptomyces sp. MP131-18]
MSVGRTLATARRVLRQLGHDRRTVALLLFVPLFLLTLLHYVFESDPRLFDRVGASLLGIFPLITMFLTTSIATLRERTTGTLERLMAMPLGKGDLIFGYALAFGAFAVLQAGLATAVGVWLLDLDLAGSPWLLLFMALLTALLGIALGLFVSAFAASEFQAVQFMPALIVPQILVCGLFAPRDTMQPALEYASNVLPMSYSVNAMTGVLNGTGIPDHFLRDVAVVVGMALGFLALAAVTLRRRTP